MNVNAMLFGFIPKRETTYKSFVVRRMQAEYKYEDKKLYLCFVDIEKEFDRVSRKVYQR